MYRALSTSRSDERGPYLRSYFSVGPHFGTDVNHHHPLLRARYHTGLYSRGTLFPPRNGLFTWAMLRAILKVYGETLHPLSDILTRPSTITCDTALAKCFFASPGLLVPVSALQQEHT